jgi:hypothetical protein
MGQLISRPVERIITKVLDEALEPIKTDLAGVKSDLAGVKSDLAGVKSDLAGVKSDLAGVKSDLAGVKSDLGGVKSDLGGVKSDLKALTDAILVPEGTTLSKKIAVSIKDSSSGPTSGHGAVVRIAEKSYLLSAAHVLVDFTMDFRNKAEPKTIHLERAGKKFACTSTGKLYVPPDYVLKGSKDIGFLGISFDSNLNPQEFISAKWAEAEVGNSVVASGLVHLLGIVTSFSDGRFSVLAHSVPGQSGSLVLDSSPAVTGVVHGSSKHRGKHSGDTFRDDASVVYCDAVVLDNLIAIEDNALFELLQYAEDIPEDIASGSRKASDCTEDCGFRKLVCKLYLSPEQLALAEDDKNKRLAEAMQGLTLAEVMKALFDQMPKEMPKEPVPFANIELCAWKE